MKLSQQIKGEKERSFIYILIATKSTPKSLYCFGTRSIEDQIDPLERYNHERKAKPIETYWLMCLQLR